MWPHIAYKNMYHTTTALGSPNTHSHKDFFAFWSKNRRYSSGSQYTNLSGLPIGIFFHTHT